MTRKDRERRARTADPRNTGITADELATGAVVASSRGVTSRPYRKVPEGAAEILGQLAERDDGWLRMSRKRDTGTVYIKWKFTHGRKHNTYIMSVCEYWQLDYGFAILAAKLLGYDTGDDSDLAVDTYHQVVKEANRDA